LWRASSSTHSNADLARDVGRHRPALIAFRATVFCAVIASACGAVVAGNAAVERAFADHRSGLEVTAHGTVTRILSDNAGPRGTHQRFVVRLAAASQTVLVENNVDIGKRVPIATGDEVLVHGEYVWNDEGGLIHFTHHDPAHTHEDGWIEVKGIRYG
jgi:hypothetical protein